MNSPRVHLRTQISSSDAIVHPVSASNLKCQISDSRRASHWLCFLTMGNGLKKATIKSVSKIMATQTCVQLMRKSKGEEYKTTRKLLTIHSSDTSIAYTTVMGERRLERLALTAHTKLFLSSLRFGGNGRGRNTSWICQGSLGVAG